MRQSEFKKRYDRLKRGDMLRNIFMVKVLLPMFSKRLVESNLERR